MRAKRATDRNPAKLKWKGTDRAVIWKIVEGAVLSACDSHPDYFTDRGRDRVVVSVTKRVVGVVHAHLNEVRKDGPSGS